MAEEARYMYAYSLFKSSPKDNLDQSNSVDAMAAMQEFLNRYPNSKFRDQSIDVIVTTQKKLERKGFDNSYQYYKMRQYKAAIVALKSSLAAEWASKGIRVNSISPGYMDTILNAGDGLEEMRQSWASRNPMGRMGAVGELDGVCVLLASRAGSYINGADFVVDGGAIVF